MRRHPRYLLPLGNWTFAPVTKTAHVDVSQFALATSGDFGVSIASNSSNVNISQ